MLPAQLKAFEAIDGVEVVRRKVGVFGEVVTVELTRPLTPDMVREAMAALGTPIPDGPRGERWLRDHCMSDREGKA